MDKSENASTREAPQQWVALFYSVVIDPTRRMKSADLLDIAQKAGLDRARTALSTGNLIGWTRSTERDVEERLEQAAEAIVGKRIAVLCRSAADFRKILASNPFNLEPEQNPSEVAIRVMRSAPASDVVERLLSKAEKGDRFFIRERALWLAGVNPLPKSRLMRAINAAWVGVGTTRSLSSLRKIEAAI